MPKSPTVGRPAQGWSTARAQKWVLAASILAGVVYTFRRLVEPATGGTAKGGAAATLLGAGSPPPPLGQWLVAWSAADFMLALLALGAPEIAASLAMLMIAGLVLGNGLSITADLTGLEGGKTATTASTPASQPGAIVPLNQLKPNANASLSSGNNPRGTAIL